MRWSEARRGPAGRRVVAGTAVAIAAGWLTAAASTVLAASPTPSALPAGDPRSSGQGPGLVGDPLLAVVVVAAIGLASLVVTLLYVRSTRGPSS